MLSTRTRIGILAVLCLIPAGCGRSPEEKKAYHLQRADKYYESQKYQEAIIEYRNVLRIDSSDPHVLQRLGFAYYALGEIGHAFQYLHKAKEMAPDNLEVRLKLGSIYLMGQMPEEAREEASGVLEKTPDHFEALLLLAGASDSLAEIADAIRHLKEVEPVYKDQVKFHIALGTLYLRSEDMMAAEQAFKEAVRQQRQYRNRCT